MNSHYRNKTIFSWDTYVNNNISSIISLHIMNHFKKILIDINIRNLIIRNIHHQIAIILQFDDHYIEETYKYNIYCTIKNVIKNLDIDYELKYFAIQTLYNKKFIKNENIQIYKKQYIKFTVNYFNPVIISLLPDSFYQPNISILNIYYEKFDKWIKTSKCTNIINLGDDGGNICSILHNHFDNMITLFHCEQSFKCAKEIIKDNQIQNLKLTFQISQCTHFDNQYNNIILFINPGRKGLHDYELDFIHKSKNINYIVYLACNYQAFLKNADKLNEYYIIDRVELNVMPHTNITQNLIYMKKN